MKDKVVYDNYKAEGGAGQSFPRTDTHCSSVVTMLWPEEPQSLLGPLTLAHATYHLLAWNTHKSTSWVSLLLLQQAFPRLEGGIRSMNKEYISISTIQEIRWYQLNTHKSTSWVSLLLLHQTFPRHKVGIWSLNKEYVSISIIQEIRWHQLNRIWWTVS